MREETGINIDINDVHFINYNSSPDESRQNVGMRFVCFVPPNTEFDISKIETKNEVDELKWLKVGELQNMGKYLWINNGSIENSGIKWAFGHDQLIKFVLKEYYKNI